MKKILITGATGLIGTKICKKLISDRKEITVFTRNPERAKKVLPGVKNFIEWNYERIDDWMDMLNGKDAIINLAGANLGAKRWNDKYKRKIYDSRIISTRNLVEAIKHCNTKPKVFISASAVGYYGDRGNEILTEESKTGEDFTASLCSDWEKEAAKIEEYNVRRASLRIGLVLSKEGGVLKKFLLPFKLFIGGPLGSGQQWFPCIHIDDLTDFIIYTLMNEQLTGPINCASPEIVTMKEFAKTLGQQLHRPALLPVPKFMLKIIKGEIADAAVSSQKLSVKKITDSGFNFKFGNLKDALRDLL